MGRDLNRDAPASPVVVTAMSMGVGASILLLVGFVVEGIPRMSVTSVAIIGWLAIVNTARAFTLWNAAQRRLAAVETAAIDNTMLIQIAAFAWVFLGEAPGAIGVIGILVVSLGAFLSRAGSSAPRRRD
jgi:drug/metabolite transporter (DMT)-like permease